MKLIYIAGPYRAANAWLIEQNIRNAEEMAMRVAELGAFPVCPHTNNRFFFGTLNENFWLAGTMELLRRCNAVALCHGWIDSSGTLSEIEEATKIKIPVFDTFDNLKRFVKDEYPYDILYRNPIIQEHVKVKAPK